MPNTATTATITVTRVRRKIGKLRSQRIIYPAFAGLWISRNSLP